MKSVNGRFSTVPDASAAPAARDLRHKGLKSLGPTFLATIGYEKAGFEDFARRLTSAGVTRVLDVRDLPLSRRAGFSKRQLDAGLHEWGIAYSHLKGLGTPKEGRLAARAGRMGEFEAIFAAHMQTERAQAELGVAEGLVRAEKCCLLCFEADPACCHRSVVAAALHEATGLTIRDLKVHGEDLF